MRFDFFFFFGCCCCWVSTYYLLCASTREREGTRRSAFRQIDIAAAVPSFIYKRWEESGSLSSEYNQKYTVLGTQLTSLVVYYNIRWNISSNGLATQRTFFFLSREREREMGIILLCVECIISTAGWLLVVGRNDIRERDAQQSGASSQM